MPFEKRFHLGFTVILQPLIMLTLQRGHLHPTPLQKHTHPEPTGVVSPILAY